MMPGESHILRAALSGDNLTVTADHQIVWQGSVPHLSDGPAGLRTDNARFELDYYVSALGNAEGPARCEAASED